MTHFFYTNRSFVVKEMALKAAFVLLVCALVQGQNCPPFTCSALLNNNVCANRNSDGVYQLNANGCNSAYHCSLADLFSWIAQAGISAGSTDTDTPQSVYACVADLQETTASKDWKTVSCPGRQVNRGFKSGQATVTCTQDTDCELADGATTTCVCSFRTDGYGLCLPDISNDLVFEGYWTECAATGEISSESTYNYWTQYREMYVYQQSPLTCVDIFQELQDLYTLWTEYTSAEMLAVALMFSV